MTQQALEKEANGYPLYKSLEAVIQKEIKSGKLKPGQRLESTTILAKKWHVSHTTVVNSLQRLAAKGMVTRKPRSGTYVSTDSELMIQEGSNTAKSNIALVGADNRFPELLPILEGFQDVAHENKLHIVVGNTNGTPERFDEVIRHQIDSNAYGIFLGKPVGPGLSVETICELKKSGIPVVQLYESDPGADWPSIGDSTQDNIRLAVQHLYELGRKKIACVGYVVNPSDLRDYFHIFHYLFIQNLAKVGLSYDPEYQLSISAPRNFESAMHNGVDWIENIKQWLSKHEDIDAIFCSYDRIAWAVLKALEQQGKRVPEDVAVIGVGNLKPYYEFAPSLTTIDVGSYQVGAEACKLLIAMNNGEKMEPNLHITVKSKLILGQSTMPVRSDNK